MISTLFNKIRTANNFDLQEIADLMGISLDRAKNLSTGRVKKFKPKEMQVLVDKLGINSYWLMTGEGNMHGDKSVQGVGLSIDEEMLLSAYREMTALEKKEILQLVLAKSSVSEIANSKGIINSPNSKIHNSFNNQAGFTDLQFALIAGVWSVLAIIFGWFAHILLPDNAYSSLSMAALNLICLALAVVYVILSHTTTNHFKPKRKALTHG